MKVLHVFSTFGPGGSETRTADLMHGLGTEFEHHVVSMDGRVDCLPLCPDGVRLVATPEGLKGMRQLLADEAPDLLCTYNWGSFDAVIAARMAGRRAHLHHEDGFNADEAKKRKLRRNLARRFGLTRAHRLIVPSRLLEGIALKEWGQPQERIAWIVNGVDTERFCPGETDVRAKLGIPGGAVVAGAVGHLRPVKRYDRLFEAILQLPDVHLLLVGDGVQREALEKQADGCERIHFAGHQVDVAPFYRAMDMLVCSSDSEQLPVTQLEAMACGKPVCGTDVGDVRLTAPEEGRDLFLPPGTGEELAGRIAALAGDAERRVTLGLAGRERIVEKYSREAMLTAYRALYLGAAGAAR